MGKQSTGGSFLSRVPKGAREFVFFVPACLLVAGVVMKTDLFTPSYYRKYLANPTAPEYEEWNLGIVRVKKAGELSAEQAQHKVVPLYHKDTGKIVAYQRVKIDGSE